MSIRTLISLATSLLLVSCGLSSKSSFKINGVVGETPITDSSKVIFVQSNNGDTLGICPVVDGIFSFQGEVSDSITAAYAMLDNNYMALIYIEAGIIDVNLAAHSAKGTYLNDESTTFSDTWRTLNTTAESYSVSKEYYMRNIGNLLATSFWNHLVNYLSYDEMVQLLETANEEIRNDPSNEKMLQAKFVEKETSIGKKFVDFEALKVNIQNQKDDETTTLGAIIAQGKPVLVDFWASWCGSCHKEIEKYLTIYYPEFKEKVNFVSVAVWEEDINQSREAMAKLHIVWPVIYTGGRENSPTLKYGILGIPYIMLIGADGIIKARDLRGEEIKTAIQEELKN